MRTIESKHNPHLKELRRALASPGRDLAGIEGPNLVAEALRAGLALPSVFVAHGSEALLETLALPPETEVFSLPRELLSSALATEAPQPLAALLNPPEWNWEDLLQKREKPLLAVLAGVQDPGNLGTILRSAEAFGATGVLSLPGTVSPWNPKAVRASAGSVFRMPFVAATPEEAFARLRAANITLWTTAVRDAQPAHEAPLNEAAAILIGNEGNGVPEAIAAEADAALTIPCPGAVESLNAAVAASILFYEASRQRAAGKSAKASAAAKKRTAR